MNHRFTHRRHSLASRLIWLFVIMAILFVVLVGGSMGLAFKQGFEDRLRPHLVRYLEYVQADLGTPPDLARAKALAKRVPVEIHIFLPDQTWSSTGKAPDLGNMRVRDRFTENGVQYEISSYHKRDYLLSRHPNVTLAFSIPNNHDTLHWRLLIPVAILLAVLAVLHHATRRLFRPIETLKEGVERIGSGDLNHRVQIDRRDELGDLAGSINTMAGEIQQMLEAKRQMLLAISHELRSPLTRAKVLLEMLDDRAQRDELNRELDEMERLVEELLETERLSTSHRILNRSEFDLRDLITEVISGDFAGCRINVDLPGAPVRVDADAMRIRLLLRNLIDNAIRHNRADMEPIKIGLFVEADRARIDVQDFGDGIDAQHLPHLTEPFYRVDPSRQRQTGGYGLGLYLCRVIAEAHGGSLRIHSEKHRGTLVTVLLPV